MCGSTVSLRRWMWGPQMPPLLICSHCSTVPFRSTHFLIFYSSLNEKMTFWDSSLNIWKPIWRMSSAAEISTSDLHPRSFSYLLFLGHAGRTPCFWWSESLQLSLTRNNMDLTLGLGRSMLWCREAWLTSHTMVELCAFRACWPQEEVDRV